MELINAIPIDEIKAKIDFPLEIITYKFQDIGDIISIAGNDIHSTALNVWNRIVQYKYKSVNPQAIAKWINSNDPLLYKKIEKIIKKPVFKDVAYFEGARNGKTIAKVILILTYPNSLHLADVYFQNLSVRLPECERKQFRDYKGFGLLPIVINSMKEYAKRNSIEYLTLTAASIDHVPLFERYGFTVEDNEVAKIGLRTGYCIGMELKME